MTTWMTERERWTLGVIGVLGASALAVAAWQRPRAPIRVEPMSQPAPTAAWDAMLRQAAQVDLNRATAEELERLPKIGPGLARRIVAFRIEHGPFATVEGLRQVPGVGPATLAALQGYLTVGDASHAGPQ